MTIHLAKSMTSPSPDDMTAVRQIFLDAHVPVEIETKNGCLLIQPDYYADPADVFDCVEAVEDRLGYSRVAPMRRRPKM